MAPEDESGRQNNDQIHQSSNRKLNPPPKQTKLNLGKKIGLSFAGIAVFLQVVVIAFLVLNRRQLLKTEIGSSKSSNGNVVNLRNWLGFDVEDQNALHFLFPFRDRV
nr:neural Wiskott-Aldrich syndrome protein isoform X1 [Ipomoea trifida]